jgi:hypothetical protein
MTRRVAGRAAPVVVAGLLALAGCAGHRTGEPGPPAGGAPGTQVYQAAGTVLESPGTGPQLCFGVAESYPPQCQGPELVGWDWSAVEAESASGTTWGSFRLTGTWDGERFTLTGPPRPDDGRPAPGSGEPDFASPCPEPAGGWRPVDPDTATEDALAAAFALASGDPGYAGGWLDQSYLDDQGGEGRTGLEQAANDPTRLVLNLRFTGELAGRERSVRQVWGGALCVSRAGHTEAELVAVQQRLQQDLPEVLLGSGVDVVANAVTAQVYVADRELRQEVDRRYGAGTVILDGWLRPLS